MSSIFRKAFWPASIALGMLMLMAALGTTGTISVKPAQAFDGEVCDVVSSPVMGVNDVIAVAALIDGESSDLWNDGVEYDAAVDETSGNASIVGYVDPDPPDGQTATSSDISNLAGDEFLVEGIDGRSDNISLLDTGDPDDNWSLGLLDELWDEFALNLGPDGDLLETDAGGCDVDDSQSIVIVLVECQAPGVFDVEFTVSDDGIGGQDESGGSTTITCLGNPSKTTLTLTPARVQIVPSDGDVSHSLALLTVTDSAGNPADPGFEVDWSVDHGCGVDTHSVNQLVDDDDNPLTPQVFGDELTGWYNEFSIFNPNYPLTGQDIEFDFQPFGPGAHNVFAPPWSTVTHTFSWTPPGPPGTQPITVAAAIVHCDFATAVPGVATVTARIDVFGAPDIITTASLTVVGPPANIVVSVDNASPVCSGRVTVTAKITDSIGQNVSDHTLAEAVTTLGGVLAGTGAVAAQAGLVTPISSTVGETFSGVVTFFLLLSDTQSTHYEIVVTSGGGGEIEDSHDFGDNSNLEQFGLLGGIFSTPPVSGYAAVDCKAPSAPAVLAPNTGTGPLRAPNTGDAGLASTSGGSSLVLFGIAAAAVFALMGLGALKAVRR